MDTGFLWVGVCALSVVCLGVLGVGAFIVFKGGFGIFKDLYASNLGEEDTEASSMDASSLRRRTPRGLGNSTRGLGGSGLRGGMSAQSSDPFEEALRRRRGEGASEKGKRPPAQHSSDGGAAGNRRIPRNPTNQRDWGAGNSRNRDNQEIYDDDEGGFF